MRVVRVLVTGGECPSTRFDGVSAAAATISLATAHSRQRNSNAPAVTLRSEPVLMHLHQLLSSESQGNTTSNATPVIPRPPQAARVLRAPDMPNRCAPPGPFSGTSEPRRDPSGEKLPFGMTPGRVWRSWVARMAPALRTMRTGADRGGLGPRQRKGATATTEEAASGRGPQARKTAKKWRLMCPQSVPGVFLGTYGRRSLA